jgi:hypothetical protein
MCEPPVSVSGTPAGLRVLGLGRRRGSVPGRRHWPTGVTGVPQVAVENGLQDAKEICRLGKGQVTCWNSWHSWRVITLIAYAFPAVTAALERAAQSGWT